MAHEWGELRQVLFGRHVFAIPTEPMRNDGALEAGRQLDLRRLPTFVEETITT